MNTLTQITASPVQAFHRDGNIDVTLADGRTLSFPVSISPRLAAATPAQRQNIELLPFTLHWPDVDEDLTIETLFELGYGR